MTPLPAQPNQSLMEGLDVLFHLSRKARPAGVRPMARELGMTPTRTQRYLGTLAHLGLATRTPDRKYTPGPAIHVLSAIGLRASGLLSRAVEHLPSLSADTHSVALGVLWRQTVSYLYFQGPGAPVAQALGRTEDYPAWDSVVGLAMLTAHTDASLRAEFPAHAEEVVSRVRRTRECGYAQLERANGHTALAVPVGSPPIAGLALTGRLRDPAALLEPLHQTARRLTRDTTP